MPTQTIVCNATGGTASSTNCTATTVQGVLGFGIPENVQVFTASGTWTAPAAVAGQLPSDRKSYLYRRRQVVADLAR